ncbi:hypothetical protein [Massilia litorea]|uniref:HAF repeat-containing protein n=1 Tax=Massilia litorea TaxID=2769491 RepID=A0A7L9UB86_9BURK|nr:hypothetical protein [Massilia litorea]QOL52248.1 hypothetical protein LPB04_23860 [Massilia litorea]
MAMRHRFTTMLFLTILTGPLVAQAGPISYAITPIGTVGGVPASINNGGEVAGYFASGESTHAFLYTANTFVDLGTLGGGSSRAGGINDAGVVVGSAENFAGETRAFIYANGTMSDLGTLGGANSSAAAINNKGQIVGVADSVSGSFAFAYTPDAGMQNLGTLPGGVFSRAESINDVGTVVGGSLVGDFPLAPFHAFEYASGSMYDLGSLNGAWSVGKAINNNGETVGWSNAGFNVDHAVLYADGLLTDLGTLNGFGSSLAYDINDAGQIVGSSEVYDRESRGFLYEEGAMIDLTTLIDSASGWTIESAYSINNQHQIAAFGCKADVCQTLLLDPVTPVPEPQTDSTLLAGLLLIRWVLRGRRTRVHLGSGG